MTQFLRSGLMICVLLMMVSQAGATDLAILQQNYVDQQYGVFLHFNMGTFTNEEWAAPDQNTNQFNPVGLDTDQWAATAEAAGMKYGVLTTKHHDGFALWDTDQSDYDIANSACSWYWDEGYDVVASYANSFRDAGLGVGLYYSIWDRTNGINHTLSSAAATAYVKAEITHLLTSYGFIEVLWTDGWGWLPSTVGYDYVDYDEVYNHIKTVSADTLLLENNPRNRNLDHTDIEGFEQNLPPVDNTLPAESYPTLRLDNKWFYATPNENEFKSAAYMGEFIRTVQARNATCLLDVPPNRDGVIQQTAIDRLMEIKDNLDNPPPVPDNLALYKTATQSSNWGSYTADKAVDFDRNNFSHTAKYDEEAWWMVDLGETKSIGEVDMYNRVSLGGRLRDITVEILADDGATVVYTSPLLNPGNILGGGIDDYHNGPNPLILFVNDGDGAVGRYLRISREAESTPDDENAYALTLAEVEVFRAFIPGDADGDGRVDATDAQILAQHWGDAEASWEMGDFSGNEIVDASDAAILAANWGFGTGETCAAAVPEPATIALLLGTLVALAVRRPTC